MVTLFWQIVIYVFNGRARVASKPRYSGCNFKTLVEKCNCWCFTHSIKVQLSSESMFGINCVVCCELGSQLMSYLHFTDVYFAGGSSELLVLLYFYHSLFLTPSAFRILQTRKHLLWQMFADRQQINSAFHICLINTISPF